ncbi:MAG: hypothetical protein M3R59_05125 [Verrucomicrobiota bacterium]|nr:hypothetical protein [Verrucomicrobiota bacterium]
MKKMPALPRAIVSGILLALPLVSIAQTVDTIADREAARREARVPHGEEALARARVEMEARQFGPAHEDFRMALINLPASAVAGKSYDGAMDGFCESGVRLAEQRVAEGKYAEAEQILNEILSDQYNPRCREAATLLAHLHTPGYINKTMGPKFLAKIEDVKKLLTEGEGFYKSGRYDMAQKRYDQVLAIDPYNTAARRGQEQLDNTKYHYAQEAYNETRGRSVWQVEKAWEEPVRQYGQTVGPLADAFQKDATGTARINNKLSTIIIPRIEFRDASIREAIDFLRQQAIANDPGTDGRRGVDIVLRLRAPGGGAPPAPAITTTTTSTTTTTADANGPVPALDAGETAPPAAVIPASVAPAAPVAPAINPTDARITLTLNQIPLGEALRYIASQAGLKVKVEPYAVSIIPLSEQSNELITKEYRVPPGFISGTVNNNAGLLNAPPAGRAGGATGLGGGTATGTQESTGGQQLVSRETARDFLESQGVPFSTVPGSSANFLPQSSRLIVRNTPDNLELVDAIVEQASVSGPKQVEIESKFIEITQTNSKELGVDWLLAPFNIPGNLAFAEARLGTVLPFCQLISPF